MEVSQCYKMVMDIKKSNFTIAIKYKSLLNENGWKIKLWYYFFFHNIEISYQNVIIIILHAIKNVIV